MQVAARSSSRWLLASSASCGAASHLAGASRRSLVAVSPRKTLHSSFDDIVAQYRQFKLQSPWVRHCEEFTLMSALPSCLRDKDLLDSGCGWGYYTRLLADRQPKSLVASDIGGESVQLAEHSIQQQWPSVQFRQRDIADMTEEQQYDIVVCNLVLPYATDTQHLQRMCNRLFAALKPGGCLLGFIPNGDSSVDFSREAIGRQLQAEFVVPPDAKDGDEGQIVSLNLPTETRVSFRWFYHSTYSRCLHAAGFASSRGTGSVEFLRPKVSPAGVEEFGREFWDSVVLPPMAWLVRATRAS